MHRAPRLLPRTSPTIVRTHGVAGSIAALLVLVAPAIAGAEPATEPNSVPAIEPSTAPAPDPLSGVVFMPGTRDETVPGARVRVQLADGTELETTTDLDGRFTIATLPPGPATLEIDADGIGQLREVVEVVAGEPLELELELTAAEAVRRVVVRSAADEKRRSAEAVDVVEIGENKRRAADLGEVLARTRGVGVRRAGGLGSQARFSLNGLTDDQIRFFVDGVPLEYTGYPFGLVNIPLGLLDRVDIYRGVVPIRYGADALGGAVDVVTDAAPSGTHASGSYQVGSFNTHRLGLTASHMHAPTGLFVRGSGFFDYSDNDFAVDVETPDARGRLHPVRIRRFHDRYRAGGGNLEVGVVEHRWADRLIFKVFGTAYDKQQQTNIVMSVPYGGLTFAETTAGTSVRYEHEFGHGISLQVVGGYAWSRTHYEDLDACVYDWFGRCVRERSMPGELENRPHDQLVWQHSGYGRVVAGWRPHRQHQLSVSVAPTYTTRHGDERRQARPTDRDPLTAQRDVFAFVAGVEYQSDFARDRLQNVVFAKAYVQALRSDEPIEGGFTAEHDRTTRYGGAGDALRLRILDWMYAKASYEYATRLPTPDEIFGDAMLVAANLELKPEISHNANLSFDIDAPRTRAGGWRLGSSGFLRDADELIVLLGSDRFYKYQNVFGARSLGVDAAGGWTSPGEYFSIDGNVTYQSFRNLATEGPFATFEGDRIPNRPYFFANGSASLMFRDVVRRRDRFTLYWDTRYVHSFYRSWESAGMKEGKDVVPTQVTHGAAASYVAQGKHVELGVTLEVQNLSNARVFDYFGSQRPGRGYYAKISLAY